MHGTFQVLPAGPINRCIVYFRCSPRGLATDAWYISGAPRGAYQQMHGTFQVLGAKPSNICMVHFRCSLQGLSTDAWYISGAPCGAYQQMHGSMVDSINGSQRILSEIQHNFFTFPTGIFKANSQWFNSYERFTFILNFKMLYSFAIFRRLLSEF